MNLRSVLYLCIAVLLGTSCASNKAVSPYPTRIADIEPFSVGTVNASIDRAFSSGVKEVKVDVVFYPRTNEVALEFVYGVSPYKQFWDQAGRQQFVQAINRYKDDFANRNLSPKYSRTRTVYGKVKGNFHWKPIPASLTYKSFPVYELGYRFKDKAPYFSVVQRSASEETKNQKDRIKESTQYSLYFTRAQGDEMIRLFDQALLVVSLGDLSAPVVSIPDRDTY